MMKHRIKYKGFTIVELLIMIVVIAILAVISVMTFSDVKERATVSVIEAGASAYIRAIQTYRAKYGHFPLANERAVYVYGDVPVYGFCVGARESYPSPQKGCGGWTLNGLPTDINKYKSTDGFHREILKTITNQSSPHFECFYIAGNGSCTRGYMFLPDNAEYASKLDGKIRNFFGYFLPGKHSCRIYGELAKTNQPIGDNFIDPMVSYVSNLPQDYTIRNDRVTLCLYAL